MERQSTESGTTPWTGVEAGRGSNHSSRWEWFKGQGRSMKGAAEGMCGAAAERYGSATKRQGAAVGREGQRQSSTKSVGVGTGG